MSTCSALKDPSLMKIFSPASYEIDPKLIADNVDVKQTDSYVSPIFKGFDANQDVGMFFFEQNYGDSQHSIPVFQKIAIGGTFDCLHNGHRKLVAFASSVCSTELTIGITGDAMIAKKSNATLIASFNERKETVAAFLRIMKPELRINAVELVEPYGPTITDPTIEAIVVSSETILGAFKINDIRLSQGMRPLFIFVTMREDTAALSSTFIRNHRQLKKTILE
jgi:cytidyltransferase-like protein